MAGTAGRWVWVFLGMVFAQPAMAMDCKPLHYAGAFAVAFDDRGALQTRVMLNGLAKTMDLTGGTIGTLSHPAVAALGLSQHSANIKLYSSTGEMSDTVSTVAKLSAGSVSFQDVPFQVFGQDTKEAGSIALQMFGNMDMDFDLAGGRVNLFSPEHCEDAVVYWPAATAAIIPYEGDDMQVSVTIAGHAAKARVSFTSESSMGLAIATELFGITAQSPGMEEKSFSAGSKFYRYVFPTLSLGGVTVTNAAFNIVPEKINTMFKERDSGTRLSESLFRDARGGIYVGNNILRKLHVYVSVRDRRLYITPADGSSAARMLPPLKESGAQ